MEQVIRHEPATNAGGASLGRPRAEALLARYAFLSTWAVALALGPAASAHAAPSQVTGPSAGTTPAPGGVFRVLLDAGHGGSDPGALSPFFLLREKDVTLRLALLAGAALKRRGVDVVYTRTDDRGVALAERAALAQRTGAGALLSLHLNSAPDPAASGAEAWHGSAPGSAELAQAVLGALAQPLLAYGVRVRGTRSDADLAALRTNGPAALLELAYVTNPREAQLLADEPFLAGAADAMAAGIAQFRDTRRPASQQAKSALAALSGLYFVQPGDTLPAIASRFRIASEDLLRLNSLADPQTLFAGQPVQVRSPQAPPAAPGATPPLEADSYTVVAGDTLSGIAEATGISVPELVRLNGLADAHLVRAGQTLRLGAPAPSRRPQRVYTVAAGDTLETIAGRYGVSVADLARWNSLPNAHLIKVGQQLRLGPTGESQPPSSVAGRRYTVQPGDTVSTVAARFGLAQDGLLRANRLSDADRVAAGRVLVLPAS